MAPLAPQQERGIGSPDAHRLLLVDDDPNVISLLANALEDLGQLRFSVRGTDALRLAQECKPDLIILDIDMPGMGGFEVCMALKSSFQLADVPVIFITGHDPGEHEIEGLALGGVDFITKPLRPAGVKARVRMHLQMKDMADALRRSAYTDGLTGIANRRHFDDVLSREWHRAERSASPISLLMIDIDAFKRFNDFYGHAAGDKCLRKVALAVQKSGHRPGDLGARFGGEEFALVLPETDAEGAEIVASHLLDAIDDLAMPHADSPVHPFVSASIGVSSFDAQCSNWSGRPADSRFGNLCVHHPVADLLRAADQALYAAKHAGRRRAHFLRLDDLDVGGRTRAIPLRRLNAIGPPRIEASLHG